MAHQWVKAQIVPWRGGTRLVFGLYGDWYCQQCGEWSEKCKGRSE